MGLKNGCCRISLRSGSLLIGWIYLIDQLFWLALLVGSATYLQNGLQSDFAVTSPPAISDEKTIEVLMDPTKPEQEDGPEVETMDVQIDLIRDPPDVSKKVSFIPENSHDGNDDYDVGHIFQLFVIRPADETNDDSEIQTSKSEPEVPESKPEVQDAEEDLFKDFSKLHDEILKMNDEISKEFSKFDDSFSAIFQDSKEIASSEPEDPINWDDLLKSMQIRNKRDIELVSEGRIKEIEIDSPEFIFNAIVIAFTIFFTILLIVGALKGIRQLLMIWIMNTSLLTVFYISYLILLVDNYFFHHFESSKIELSAGQIIFNLIRIALHIIILVIVSRHHKELKQQEYSETNLKYFIDNNAWATSTTAIVPVITEKKSKEYV